MNVIAYGDDVGLTHILFYFGVDTFFFGSEESEEGESPLISLEYGENGWCAEWLAEILFAQRRAPVVYVVDEDEVDETRVVVLFNTNPVSEPEIRRKLVFKEGYRLVRPIRLSLVAYTGFRSHEVAGFSDVYFNSGKILVRLVRSKNEESKTLHSQFVVRSFEASFPPFFDTFMFE